MPWMRLEPTTVLDHLRVSYEPVTPDDHTKADQVLAHLRAQLQSGCYICVQSERGDTFIGTPAEAADHMMA